MENEKKPQRLAVRLSALFLAVMLLVVLAVPCLADSFTLDLENEEHTFDSPSGYKYIVVFYNKIHVSGSIYRKVYSFVSFDHFPQKRDFYYFLSNGEGAVLYRSPCYYDFSEYSGSSGYLESGSQTAWCGGIVFANFPVYDNSGNQIAGPPPPDLKTDVSTGLTVVFEWVGTVVSAVVTGELSGLLILFAIPVAVTLLLVAFFVIRRIIWGV